MVKNTTKSDKGGQMIEWYKSKELSIFFDDVPYVSIRYVLPSDTDAEVKSKKKYPFINKRSLEVRIFDHKKERTYGFTIPKGYCFDGMTIPRFAWSLIGVSKENNGGLIAAMVHDFLTEHKDLIMNDSYNNEIINRH